MKILIPILGFDRAGGYRVLSELANTWVKQGHHVDFLCPDSSNNPYFPTSAGIVWVDGLGNVTNIRDSIARPNAWYHLKSLYRGLKIIGQQYDFILANHSLTAWPVALAKCGKARKIYYIQAYEPEYYVNKKTLKGYLIAPISALSYHLPLKRIVNAPIYFSYKNLQAIDYVPPGIDLDIFKSKEISRNIEDKKTIIIGCIGRHEPEKGTIYVLRAFESLYKKDNRFMLRIAYGNLPVEWKHENCEIVVPKNDTELADYYRSLDILVAPGTVQHGAAHYPVLEAGACGISVVTTGYMGATPETAWLVSNKDASSIEEAILNIVSDDNQRIGKIIKFLSEVKQFSWENVSGKMLRLFESLR